MTESAEKFIVWSETQDFRRRRNVCIFLRSMGRDNQAKITWEDVTDKLIDRGSETIPANSPSGLDGTDFLQAALDHAWEVGLRPRGFFDTPNELAATRAHLHDMRALVFKDGVKPKA